MLKMMPQKMAIRKKNHGFLKTPTKSNIREVQKLIYEGMN